MITLRSRRWEDGISEHPTARHELRWPDGRLLFSWIGDEYEVTWDTNPPMGVVEHYREGKLIETWTFPAGDQPNRAGF